MKINGRGINAVDVARGIFSQMKEAGRTRTGDTEIEPDESNPSCNGKQISQKKLFSLFFALFFSRKLQMQMIDCVGEFASLAERGENVNKILVPLVDFLKIMEDVVFLKIGSESPSSSKERLVEETSSPNTNHDTNGIPSQPKNIKIPKLWFVETFFHCFFCKSTV